ncbi:lipopolysaccharide export system permease protein [Pedobacter sp. UYEF25]
MKKLYILILKSFLKPFMATFFVVMFILIMFFLFKYVDDLIGKGFEWYTILELMYYQALVQISMALPLSVLLSSIMTFGNLGENYELVAIKAAGISLQKAMRPLFFVILLLSASSLIFSNFILPKANLKFNSLLWDVTNKKLAFLIKPGIFNNSIPNYSIRVDRKDGDKLFGILMYQTDGTLGIPKIIMAKEGIMEKTTDGKFLIFKLKDGVQYEEAAGKSGAYNPRQVFTRGRFKEAQPTFDLSSFQMQNTDPNAFGQNTIMLNLSGIKQKSELLTRQLDTLNKSQNQSLKSSFKAYTVAKGYSKLETVPKKIHDLILADIPNGSRKQSITTATNIVAGIEQSLANGGTRQTELTNEIIVTQVEYQRKFTLAASCILLFFIGAPLGAIIRKGGMGLPVVVAVVFFLIYHILTTVAEKAAKQGDLNPIIAMWIAVIVLSPLAAFLTYKASRDSALFDINYYKELILKVFRKKQLSASQ